MKRKMRVQAVLIILSAALLLAAIVLGLRREIMEGKQMERDCERTGYVVRHRNRNLHVYRCPGDAYADD